MSATQRTAGKWERAAAAGPTVAHETEYPLDNTKHTVKLNDLKKMVNDISLYQNVKLINLIGRKCLVHCLLEGVPVEVLWDMGAQASVINEEWRKNMYLIER